VKEVISMISCRGNQHSKHSVLFEGRFQEFEKYFKYILSQLSLLNLVSWPTPCWLLHCPLYKVFDSFQCICFHSLQITDHTHGLPKPWCGLLNPDCSWMQLKEAEWCAACIVCCCSMQATRCERPQGLIVICESFNNMRKCYHLKFQAYSPRKAHIDPDLPPTVRPALLQYVDPWPIILINLLN